MFHGLGDVDDEVRLVNLLDLHEFLRTLAILKLETANAVCEQERYHTQVVVRPYALDLLVLEGLGRHGWVVVETELARVGEALLAECPLRDAHGFFQRLHNFQAQLLAYPEEVLEVCTETGQ